MKAARPSHLPTAVEAECINVKLVLKTFSILNVPVDVNRLFLFIVLFMLLSCRAFKSKAMFYLLVMFYASTFYVVAIYGSSLVVRSIKCIFCDL
jgi:hypothetical protein